ncbi:MAG: hypothetical protein ACTHLD_15490 [Chitinophaga sp.]
MHLFNRFKAPTPLFFQKARNWGLVLTAISASIMGLPFALPAVVTTVASYFALGGAVLSGVSQAAVEDE